VISGRLREGSDWLGAVIERFAAPSAERAGALIARSYLGAFRGEAADAASDAREGIRIAAKLGACRLEAWGYLYLHRALTFGGDWFSGGDASGMDRKSGTDHESSTNHESSGDHGTATDHGSGSGGHGSGREHEEAASTGAAGARAEAERLLTALRDGTGLTLLTLQQARLSQLSGHPEQAIRLCKRALRRIGDGGERWLHGQLHTIAAIARIQVPGEEKQATANAVRGLRAARDIGDVTGTAYALEALAWLAAATGRPMRAAWLTGAADPLWGRVGKRMSGTPVMLEAHRRAVATATRGLGQERFAALRSQGASCPLDVAVAAAAGDADNLDAILPIVAAWQSGTRPARAGRATRQATAGQYGSGRPAGPRAAQASPGRSAGGQAVAEPSPGGPAEGRPAAGQAAGQAPPGRSGAPTAEHAAAQPTTIQLTTTQAAGQPATAQPATAQSAAAAPQSTAGRAETAQSAPARTTAGRTTAGRSAAGPTATGKRVTGEPAPGQVAERAAGKRTGAPRGAGRRSVSPRADAERPADAQADGREAGPWTIGLDGLTGREQEIAVLVATGLSNREIGARLVISKRTVDAHVEHIFAKLGMSSRVQLTIWLRDQLPDTWGQSGEQSLP
jgi:DNA-binding CsgD family transcriptional regulator